MKKVIFVFVLAIGFLTSADAQFKGGIKGGVTTYNMRLGDFLVTNSAAADDFSVAVKNADFGYQFGVWARLGKGLHLQPELLYSADKITYEIEDGGDIYLQNATLSNIEMPVLVGLKIGPIRAQAGPVAKVFLHSKDESNNEINAFESDHDRLKLGYQAGLGLSLWRLQVDLRYEGNLQHFGNSVTIGNQSFALDNQAGRVVASVGIAF